MLIILFSGIINKDHSRLFDLPPGRVGVREREGKLSAFLSWAGGGWVKSPKFAPQIIQY